MAHITAVPAWAPYVRRRVSAVLIVGATAVRGWWTCVLEGVSCSEPVLAARDSRTQRTLHSNKEKKPNE